MPPCWTRTQLSGYPHYPTCGSGGEPEHRPPQRDNGHMTQTPGALLFLVAPALHVHPVSAILLRYFAPAMEGELVGTDERGREGVKPGSASGLTGIRDVDPS